MLGKRIAELRKNKGISQYELAERLGFSRGKLANYEQGSRQPDYETLQQIADYFEVTTDYLLGRSDNPESLNKVIVAGKEIELTPEEFKVFEELKKHSIAFHDLASDPEKKVKQLIKMYEFIQKDLKELDEKLELGEDGFGQFED